MGIREFLGIEKRTPTEEPSTEKRASLEDPTVPISDRNILTLFGLGSMSATGEVVTVDNALGIPAVWAAVNFLSGTMAGLPLHVFERDGDARKRTAGTLETILNDAVNDGMSSFDWRKYSFDQVFTDGRAVSFIERNTARRVVNIWPLDPNGLTIKRVSGRKVYVYKDGSRTVTYQADEVIDIPFMLKRDMLAHYSPIMSNKDAIGLAQAITKYGSKFFQNGGVPPFAIEGPFQSPGGAQRASDDLAESVKKAAKESRLGLAIPAGHKIHQIGVDAEKSQMVETQRFNVEQIARIYSLPPTFLQDLTHGTFSNTEQQDLHLTKHTIKRWVEQFEKELNLKLFGRHNTKQFVEMNLDGLLRGDFKTRMEGYANAIQNSLLKPNEARRHENYPDDPDGDNLMINSATVPISSLATTPSETPQENDNEG